MMSDGVLNRRDAKAAKKAGAKTERKDNEKVAAEIVDGAVTVHRELGPGLLESAYQKCLTHELRSRGFNVACEVALPVEYRGLEIDAGYRIDMTVDDCVIIENKTVEQILPIHPAQVLTYLKMSGCRLGFLLNWNVRLMKDGITRLVNNL